MVEWIGRLRHRRRQRMINRAALQVVADGHGVAARTWLLTPAPTSDELAAIQRDALAWLVEQIAVAASPYGWSQCSILVGLARSDGTRRTTLWKATLPAFTKAERAAGLAAAQAQLAALPLNAYPTATQLEVYLLDMGAVLREAFVTLDAQALEKN